MSKKSSNKGFNLTFNGLNQNSDGSFSAPGRYDVKKNLTATVKTLKAIDTKLFEGIDSKNWGSGGRNEVRRNAIRRKTKRPNEIRRSHIKSKKRTSLKNRRH